MAMAMVTAAAKSELPDAVGVFDPVDDAGLGKGVQGPVNCDPV
mgnify:CR=1 FL=1